MTQKQTAVEWLFQKLPTIDKYDPYYSDIIKKAKQMEKEQIIDAYFQCGRDNFEHIKVINRSATDYYNDTYGSKENNYLIVDTNEMIEISDDDILDAARNAHIGDIDISVGSFELGARWYREQLKQKHEL